MIRKYFLALDDRLQAAPFARKALNKAFPDNWSFLIGEIALYAFIVILATGLFLTMFFEADTAPVVYDGSYLPLVGRTVSRAYDSAMNISFDVTAGLTIRQMHHWAALVFVASITVHAFRVFFTGTFRKPRDLNWMIGVTLFLMAMGEGFTGYSLPDDLISGVGIRIAYSVALAIPVIGTWLCFLIFGGNFPADPMITRFLFFHVRLLSWLLLGLIGSHMGIMWRQKHTQFPGKGREEGNVKGSRFMPNMVIKTTGIMFVVFAVIAFLGAFFQINPIWLYGPYEASAVAQPAQPDWYIGWLEGALRLFPDWELPLGPYTVGNTFFPGVLVAGLFFNGLYMWPMIERRITKDESVHHLLDRPRDMPWRTGVGASMITFMFVLTLAGANDVLSKYFKVDVDSLTVALRYAVILGPVVIGFIVYKLCDDLRKSELHPAFPHRRGRFVRTEEGGFKIEDVSNEIQKTDTVV